jgi:hypothetical protein
MEFKSENRSFKVIATIAKILNMKSHGDEK